MISNIVSADWLIENLNLPNLVILDATLAKPKGMEPDVPKDVQIQGAKFFDIDSRFSDASIGLPHMMCDAEQFENAAQALGINNDSLVIVYDDHGVYSSPRAWWMLKSMGHKQVAVLNGGLPKWVQKNYPTEPKKNKSNKGNGNFKATYERGCFVNAEYIFEHLDDEDILVLDARSKGRFDAIEPEPRAGLRGGHIPNSVNIPFPEVLSNGLVLKSKNELKSVFNQYDLRDKKRLVFSCGSGLTACIVLLAAHIAGYEDLTVYDGSWSEWGQPSDLPVEA
ncbi:MAG: sulfurtransferase [Ekhidna sp.]|uniref:sulfurtransferase n=1 Tax=Ekhidna sp. TaxID=2608089 RepID=UPI0032EF07DE